MLTPPEAVHVAEPPRSDEQQATKPSLPQPETAAVHPSAEAENDAVKRPRALKRRRKSAEGVQTQCLICQESFSNMDQVSRFHSVLSIGFDLFELNP